jgi:hypothetical protein
VATDIRIGPQDQRALRFSEALELVVPSRNKEVALENDRNCVSIYPDPRRIEVFRVSKMPDPSRIIAIGLSKKSKPPRIVEKRVSKMTDPPRFYRF